MLCVVVVLIPCAIFVLNFAFTFSLRREVRQYEGEGSAQLSGKNFINYGYDVWFPTIDLSKDFSADYRVGILPKIDKSLNVLLRVITDEGTIELFKSGDLTFELYSPSQGVIRTYSGPLRDWTYSTTPDFQSDAWKFDVYFYSENLEYAKLIGKNDLRLRINYKHGDKMKVHVDGKPHISSGGFY